ncbi:hypothetical protein ZIOFF_026573 [Zingiber officinale]|uniref:Uncharacterized protein n=1 Tax=Zingiber officinale TaxID=94328 RepID=A0A8J5HGS3_ZINOF|nr:hypothetical protein ZIOFF_026573 [Zingiber officinale]
MEMEVEHEVKWGAWDDCGSSLYDSFELRSFMLQLDSAIAGRCISMPHCSIAAVQGCPSPSLTGGRLGKPTSVAWAQAIPSRGLAMRWARSKPKFAGGRLGSKAGVAGMQHMPSSKGGQMDLSVVRADGLACVAEGADRRDLFVATNVRADGLARVTKRTNRRDLFVVPKRSSHGPSTWCASRLWRRAKETEPWITQTDGLVRGTDKWTARGAKDGHIVVEFVNTGEQRADVITKALSEVKPPCDNYSAKPCRFVRSVRKLVRSLLRRNWSMFGVRVQWQDRAPIGGGAFSRSGRLEPIPEATCDLESVASSSPEIDCVGAAVRKAASERFTGRKVAM